MCARTLASAIGDDDADADADAEGDAAAGVDCGAG
jgi:hypothetical protein